MGHASTQTTERYYGRIKDKAACIDMQQAWKEAHTGETLCIEPSN